ncbi:DEAD/DEAH box helicase [Rhabdaerophilum calidifontis]|uniref:DEAD/DEAH box helicase n=1 Tax=Rhabdaerophilum calidifontis TaxID=2604328 RepID=UPI0012394B4E|nr:DEAD/DEAH box helicase [Rhabdaerophilum calidifontis]
MSFSDLGLSQRVLDAVTAAGYTQPTPIQAQAIPHVLERKDVLGIAQTGTGKTAAFTLPMLSILEQGRARARMPRTLILEPTRELAAQVEEAFAKYAPNQKLNVALLIGGVSFADQDAKITRGADVLIATPGRLLDHFERGKLLLTGIEILVIDEADRMLDMGFIPDIERIASLCPFTRQTLFFTATMPPEIKRITDQFLTNPVVIEVARPSSTASTITQSLVATHGRDYEKRETLRRLIRAAQTSQDRPLKNGIIFCNRKSEVANLYRSLERHGFSVGALHGDMDQRARMNALEAFRKNELTLLVASDVAARGLDIPDVSHVFNFDIPHHAEDYVHRIGRTGRAGRLGTAYTLVSPGNEKALAAIEKLIGKEIAWLEGDLSSLPAREPGDEEERPRKRGREPKREARPRRGEGREHVRTAKEQKILDEAASRDVAGEAGPRAAKPGRSEQSDPPRREARPRREDAPRREERPRREDRPRRDDDGPTPVGFGDAVPDFLLRGPLGRK